MLPQNVKCLSKALVKRKNESTRKDLNSVVKCINSILCLHSEINSGDPFAFSIYISFLFNFHLQRGEKNFFLKKVLFYIFLRVKLS